MKPTVPTLVLARQARPDPDDTVSLHWEDAEGWHSMTKGRGFEELVDLAGALHGLGVGPGTRLGILAETRREWMALDLANLCLGGVTIGLYPTLLAEQIAYQLVHAEVTVLVVEDAVQAAKIDAIRDQLPQLTELVSIEPVEGLRRLEELRTPTERSWFEARCAEVEPDDLATIIYTSGTTGPPKGAMLTHRNFCEVATATREAVPMEPGDRSLVFLPLAHSLQRFTIYRGLMEDTTAFFPSGIDRLPEALVHARPTVLASVPRMLEKIHDRAHATVAEKPPIAQRIFAWAFRVGRARAHAVEHGLPVRATVSAQWWLADRLVFRKIRARLGGAIRFIVSGGAALNPEVARWYLAMGVLVLEGWGLTETSAPATACRPERWRFGTVGPPLPGVEVKVADDGELLLRSPGVFGGYYKDEAATAEALAGGWFHTGDIGTVDDDGFVRITDRKKEILVTAGGKNIAPVNIEQLLERSVLVDKAVAVGHGRKYIAALLVPDPEVLDALASRHHWPDEDLATRLARPEIVEGLEAAVADANAELAPFQQVKRYTALPALFGVETGELTPTLKLKRRVVEQRWAEAIAALYD